MQNELQVFNFKGYRVRTILIDGEPWFVGKDVAEILGYTNPNEAVQDHVDEEDKLNSKMLSSFDLNLGQRGGWLINESGLYSLILSSQLPAAKEFKRWVTSEVLPSVRKTGAYNIEGSRLTLKERDLAIREKNAKVRLARAWQDLADRSGDNKEYQQICSSYASAALNDGQPVLPLPESKEKYYSVTEVGKRLGISSNKVGRIAKIHNLKTEKNGKWFFDKSQSSNKQVSNFMYNENGIEAIKSAMEEGVR